MKDRNCSSLMRCASSLQRLFFLALLSIIAIGAYAQGKTVSGTVLDKSGESVIGASVVVKGTTNGTITDFDGKFTLSNVPNDASLEISFVQDSGDSSTGKNYIQCDDGGRYRSVG